MSKTHRQRNEEKRRHTHRDGCAKAAKKKGEIDWNCWWPFTRATGSALKQLNKRQPKLIEPCEDAPF